MIILDHRVDVEGLRFKRWHRARVETAIAWAVGVLLVAAIAISVATSGIALEPLSDETNWIAEAQQAW
jgi:hypothetical protein